jgi:hypothetical protein
MNNGRILERAEFQWFVDTATYAPSRRDKSQAWAVFLIAAITVAACAVVCCFFL